MNCNNLNRMILLAAFLVAAGDILAFFIELISQRCEKEESIKKENAEQALVARIDELERRLKELEEA